MLSDRENWLRAITFGRPQWIPCSVGFAPLTWDTYREKLDDVLLRHPLMFPGHQRHPRFDGTFEDCSRGAGELFRDNWGCLWRSEIGGIEGQVVESPLADWSAFAKYQPPDVLTKTERGERDWNAIRRDLANAKKEGHLRWGNGERLFDRLYFLRGFENLMIDIATDDPHLPALIDMLTQYELKLVKLWLDAGVEVIGFHTDIGMRTSLMISPAKFRKHIKPMFKTIFQTVRQAGAGGPVFRRSPAGNRGRSRRMRGQHARSAVPRQYAGGHRALLQGQDVHQPGPRPPRCSPSAPRKTSGSTCASPSVGSIRRRAD